MMIFDVTFWSKFFVGSQEDFWNSGIETLHKMLGSTWIKSTTAIVYAWLQHNGTTTHKINGNYHEKLHLKWNIKDRQFHCHCYKTPEKKSESH